MNVSVIIPARNGARFIREAILSVLAEREVNALVVVDDGSIDETASVVRSVVDPRVALIAGAGRGVSAARNAGFAAIAGSAAEAASQSWVMFLDADDRLRPGAIGSLLAGAASDCVAVYGDYDRIDEHGRAIGRRRWLKGRRKPSGDILRTLLAGNFIVNGGVMLIRREAFQRIGGFDETLRYCEDWHAFCRLAALGPILHCPSVTGLEYRVHAASAMMRGSVGFAQYKTAMERVFSDNLILSRLEDHELKRLAREAEAHLRAYLACQSVRAHAYWRAVPESARALRSAPRRAPKTMMHILGAAAGL